MLREMQISSRIVLAVVLLSAASAHAADFSSNEIFIPIASRLPGKFGSQWRTDLVVSSRADLQFTTASAFYFPAGRTPIQTRIDLAPRQTVTLLDFIADQVGLEESYGTIYITSTNPAVKISAYVYIYNVGNPPGQYGQIVHALPVGQLSKVAWLQGLIGIRGNRTNVGVANPNNTTANFFITWFDKAGEVRGGAGTIAVEPQGVTLLNDIFALVGVPDDEGLSVRLRSDLPIYAYASVVRNDTGDAYTVIGSGSDSD